MAEAVVLIQIELHCCEKSLEEELAYSTGFELAYFQKGKAVGLAGFELAHFQKGKAVGLELDFVELVDFVGNYLFHCKAASSGCNACYT